MELLKVSVIGHERVGKTSLISCLLNELDCLETTPTESVSIREWNFRYNGERCIVHFWESRVFGRWKSQWDLISCRTDVFLLCYSMSDEKSLIGLEEIIEKANAPIILVGTHANEKRIGMSSVIRLVRKCNGHVMFSAENGIGRKEIVKKIIKYGIIGRRKIDVFNRDHYPVESSS